MLIESLFSSQYLALGGPSYPIQIKGPLGGAKWMVFALLIAIAVFFVFAALLKVKSENGNEQISSLSCWVIALIFTALGICAALFL